MNTPALPTLVCQAVSQCPETRGQDPPVLSATAIVQVSKSARQA